MSEEREEIYQILELGKHLKNLHHKKGFGGLLFIDLSMIKFSKLSSYIRQLDKENQELREKLDKYENPEDMTLMMMWCTEQVKDENKKLKKKYENAVADYETTMAEKNKLEKQLEDYKEQVNKGLYNTCLPYTTGYNKAIKDKETQQKEFIKYLEDEIQKKREKATTLTSFTRNVVPLKHCLQKYKSIIGVSDEKK